MESDTDDAERTARIVAKWSADLLRMRYLEQVIVTARHLVPTAIAEAERAVAAAATFTPEGVNG